MDNGPSDSGAKASVFVEAGRRGAAKRWGPEPRVVRIDDLTPPQRRLVLALVEAERAKVRTPVEAA